MRVDRLDELRQTRLDYWSELVRRMKRRGNLITFGEPTPGHQLRARADSFGSGKFTLVALANVRPELRIGVGVEISGPKEYYANLEKDTSRIEREIGCELWGRVEGAPGVPPVSAEGGERFRRVPRPARR